MTYQDSAKLITIIKSAYPRHFQNLSVPDAKNLAASWASILNDVPYDIAAAGLKNYIRTDNKGFPPSPGQILDSVVTDQGLTDAEAWAMVRKGIRNGIYGAEKEFAAFPPEVQKAVGSADQLREWAMMSAEDVNVTAAAHFKRTYANVKDRAKEELKLDMRGENLLRVRKLAELASPSLLARELPENG